MIRGNKIYFIGVFVFLTLQAVWTIMWLLKFLIVSDQIYFILLFMNITLTVKYIIDYRFSIKLNEIKKLTEKINLNN